MSSPNPEFPRVLGLIPARRRSKGVPDKNIRLLCGKPLLAYTVEAAIAAVGLTRVVLSTEDEEIAEIGRALGVDVPFVRPPELATDEAPMLPVVEHCVRFLEDRGEAFDAVCLLQPTNPLRTTAMIDGCIQLFVRETADSVVTVCPVPPDHHPSWVYFRHSDGTLKLATGGHEPVSRRQDLPPAFHREGSIYVVSRDVLMEQRSLYGERTVGYVVDPARSVNIDEPSDWDRAERLLEARVG